MSRYIEVQFSGKPTLYAYLVLDGEDPKPGQRVVVPTVIKNDGSVSLTIATIINVGVATKVVGVKPYVQLIDPSALIWAESETKRIEAGALTSQLEGSLK